MGDNILKVDETIPFSYEFPYKECYALSAQYNITAMNRQNRTITVQEQPENILTGDVIIVSGATVTSNFETISCNGTYTVESIAENTIIDGDNTITTYTITVEEEIPTDFVGSAILIKEVFISNISSIQNKILTLKNGLPIEEILLF